MKHTSLRQVGLLLSASFLAIGVNLGTAGAEELRIGFLAPVTGPLAQLGKDMTDGFQLYLDETKGDFHGAQVKFIREDTQGKPALAVLKAEKLINEDKVHLLVGGTLASIGYAVAPVSTREKIIYIPSIPSPAQAK